MLGINLERRIVAASLIVFCAVGCASPTQVTRLYSVSADVQPRERVLVVNVASDRGQQIDFEDAIVSRLKARNVEAVPAHTVLAKGDSLLQSDLDRAAAEASADSILITHVVSLDTTVDVVEGRTDVVSECRGGNPLDYFLYDRELIAEPDSVRVAHTVTMVSNLYDANTRERLWTIQSTCFEKSTMAEVVRDEADAIVRQLRIDGLI